MSSKKIITISLFLCLGIFFTTNVSAGFSNDLDKPPALAEPRAGQPVSNWTVISPLGDSAEPDELHGDVAYNLEDQEYLAVWDQLDDYGYTLVYGQRVSRDGSLIGSRFRISPLWVSSLMPSLVYNPTVNGYLVVYEGLGRGIYGFRLDNHGSPSGSEIQIASNASYTFRTPEVAFESDTQKYLVTWGKEQGTALYGIEARSLDVNGSNPGAILEITGMQATAVPSYPQVACVHTSDSCLVTWHKWYDAGHTDRDVIGQLFHMEGSVHIDVAMFNIFNSTLDEAQATVSGLDRNTGIGEFLVVTQRKILGVWHVYGQRVTDTGSLYPGDPFLISSGLTAAIEPAVMSKDNAQEFLVAWLSNVDISARTVSSYADLGTIRSSLPAGIDASWPAIASGLNHDFLVITQDRMASWYSLDVFGYLWGIRLFLPVVQNY